MGSINKWVTGVITLLLGVVTPFVTGRAHLVLAFSYYFFNDASFRRCIRYQSGNTDLTYDWWCLVDFRMSDERSMTLSDVTECLWWMSLLIVSCLQNLSGYYWFQMWWKKSTPKKCDPFPVSPLKVPVGLKKKTGEKTPQQLATQECSPHNHDHPPIHTGRFLVKWFETMGKIPS